MKEQDENIDQIFKENLADRSFEIPAAYVANMESMLPPSNSKNRLWWIFGLSFCAIGVMAGLYFWSENGNIQQYHVENCNSIIDSVDYENSSIDITSNKIENPISEHIDAGYKSGSTDVFELDSQSPSEAIGAMNANKNSSDSKSVYSDNSAEKKKINKEEALSNLDNRVDNSGVDSAKDEDKLKSNVLANKNEQVFENQVDSAALGLQNNSVDSSDNAMNLGSSVFNNEDSVIVRDSVVIRDSVVVRDSIVIRDSVVVRDSVRVLDGDGHKFELKMFGGLSRVNSRIVNQPAIYEINDENIISPEFGLAFNYLKNKVQMGIGLRYYQYGERTKYPILTSNSYDSTFVSYYNDTVVFDSIGNPDTLSIAVFDSTQITTSTSESTISDNYYSKIAIPLSFGYRFKYKSWTFIPQAGLNFELAVGKRMPVYPNSSYTIAQEATLRKLTIAYQLQLEIRKDFSNWFVFGSPFYRGSMSTLIEDSFVERRYNAVGGVVGIGVKF